MQDVGEIQMKNAVPPFKFIHLSRCGEALTLCVALGFDTSVTEIILF